MQEVLHANIFFVIASVATVFFSILLCLVLYQVFKITRSVRRIVERVESASELVAEDVAQLRSYVMQGGLFARILGFVMGNRPSKRRGRRRRSGSDEEA